MQLIQDTVDQTVELGLVLATPDKFHNVVAYIIVKPQFTAKVGRLSEHDPKLASNLCGYKYSNISYGLDVDLRTADYSSALRIHHPAGQNPLKDLRGQNRKARLMSKNQRTNQPK